MLERYWSKSCSNSRRKWFGNVGWKLRIKKGCHSKVIVFYFIGNTRAIFIHCKIFLWFTLKRISLHLGVPKQQLLKDIVYFAYKMEDGAPVQQMQETPTRNTEEVVVVGLMVKVDLGLMNVMKLVSLCNKNKISTV